MSAKDLIDGIRREAAVPLPLSRARNAIARLLYGSPYSAVLPAEAAGKLAMPRVDDDRVADLAAEFGPWISYAAVVARRHLNGCCPSASTQLKVNLDAIFEIAQLAAERESRAQGTGAAYVEGHGEGDNARRAELLGLTQQLAQRIQALSSNEAEQLVAVALLGRSDGASFADLLLDVHNGQHPEPTWWAEQYPLHRYLATGLHRLGDAGWTVLVSRPEMLGWLSLGHPSSGGPPAKPVPLESFLTLHEEFAAVFERADLPHPLQDYAQHVDRQLRSCDDLDYYGCDEHFEFVSYGHSQRQCAVVCILADIQIGKAYCCAGNNEAAAKRLGQARTCLESLVQVLEQGPEITRRASQGGQAKARRSDPLKREFARLLEQRRDGAKWKSMDTAVDQLLEEMQAFNNSLTPRPLIAEQMRSTLRRWLAKDASIRRAYFGESTVEALSEASD